MTKINDDPRLHAASCPDLVPVKTIHENKWFALKNRGGYYTIEYKHPQVVVLPIVENDSIVMVRVKRPVMNDITLELVAGSANTNEKPLKAAARELAEEAGIEIKDSGRFQLLPPIAIAANRYPIMPHIYQIQVSQKEFDLRKQHDEEIAGVRLYSFDEVKRRIAEGEIYVGLTIAIISRFLFQKNLQSKEI